MHEAHEQLDTISGTGILHLVFQDPLTKILEFTFWRENFLDAHLWCRMILLQFYFPFVHRQILFSWTCIFTLPTSQEQDFVDFPQFLHWVSHTKTNLDHFLSHIWDFFLIYTYFHERKAWTICSMHSRHSTTDLITDFYREYWYWIWKYFGIVWFEFLRKFWFRIG